MILNFYKAPNNLIRKKDSEETQVHGLKYNGHNAECLYSTTLEELHNKDLPTSIYFNRYDNQYFFTYDKEDKIIKSSFMDEYNKISRFNWDYNVVEDGIFVYNKNSFFIYDYKEDSTNEIKRVFKLTSKKNSLIVYESLGRYVFNMDTYKLLINDKMEEHINKIFNEKVENLNKDLSMKEMKKEILYLEEKRDEDILLFNHLKKAILLYIYSLFYNVYKKSYSEVDSDLWNIDYYLKKLDNLEKEYISIKEKPTVLINKYQEEKEEYLSKINVLKESVKLKKENFDGLSKSFKIIDNDIKNCGVNTSIYPINTLQEEIENKIAS